MGRLGVDARATTSEESGGAIAQPIGTRLVWPADVAAPAAVVAIGKRGDADTATALGVGCADVPLRAAEALISGRIFAGASITDETVIAGVAAGAAVLLIAQDGNTRSTTASLTVSAGVPTNTAMGLAVLGVEARAVATRERRIITGTRPSFAVHVRCAGVPTRAAMVGVPEEIRAVAVAVNPVGGADTAAVLALLVIGARVTAGATVIR